MLQFWQTENKYQIFFCNFEIENRHYTSDILKQDVDIIILANTVYKHRAQYK